MRPGIANIHRFARLAALVVALTVVTACGARRFEPRVTAVVRATETRDGRDVRAAVRGRESEARFARRVRDLQARAESTTAGGTVLPTAESIDPRLRDALARLALAPTAANHRAVAAAYGRLKIHDQAYEHLSHAIRLQRRDAAAFDARARLWRDLGLPHVALPDAHRAAYFAPDSPIPQNTLGTVLEALGQRDAAKRRYRRALELDPDAEYARVNVERLGG